MGKAGRECWEVGNCEGVGSVKGYDGLGRKGMLG